jgi:hypothetical protein
MEPYELDANPVLGVEGGRWRQREAGQVGPPPSNIRITPISRGSDLPVTVPLPVPVPESNPLKARGSRPVVTLDRTVEFAIFREQVRERVREGTI